MSAGMELLERNDKKEVPFSSLRTHIRDNIMSHGSDIL